MYLCRNNLPLWTWECANERCIPLKPSGMDKLQSLETCNMLCSSLQIWPQPTGSVSLATSAVPVRADFFRLKILTATTQLVREYLCSAFKLLQEDLRNIQKRDRSFESWYKVEVRITVNYSGDPRLRIDTNESYRLSLRPNIDTTSIIVDIIALSFCGARHGLETLSQLIWYDPIIDSLLILEAANIDDAPRFKYRGLLIDTARNYYPVSDLMRTVDAMAVSKLNTFHWHVSDSQAFSLKLKDVPQLAQWGAYGASDVYTTDEVRALVHRARLRGIRVLIEVNTPAHVGHAWNWGLQAGVGNLSLCADAEPWTAYCSEPPCVQLNPRNPHVYEILERIYAEILLLTGVDDIIHLGGGKISERCWSHHFSDVDALELWVEFTRTIFQRLESVYGKIPNVTLIWSSKLNERIKTGLKEYIRVLGLQIRSTDRTQKLVTGVQTVFSHEDAWDLNNGMGDWHEEGGRISYNSWQRVYEHRPWSHNGIDFVLGGEATVWSSVLGEGSLDAHIWHRVAAFAERLWTDKAEGATQPVQARLDFHLSRLAARGINAAPLWSLWCTHNTYTCN